MEDTSFGRNRGGAPKDSSGGGKENHRKLGGRPLSDTGESMETTAGQDKEPGTMSNGHDKTSRMNPAGTKMSDLAAKKSRFALRRWW